MSEGEYYLEMAMCEEPPEPCSKRSTSKYIWTCKDGTQIRVRETMPREARRRKLVEVKEQIEELELL